MSGAEREAAVAELFPVLRRLALRVSRSLNAAADVDDLVGDGAFGLLRAIDTYDPAYGTTLEQYARRLIVGAMLNGLRRIDPVSERARRTLRLAERERFARAQCDGRLASLAEMERVDPRLRSAREAAFAHSTLSLDAPLGSAGHVLADWREEPSAQAVQAAGSRALRQAVALLPERQRQVVALHYYGDLSLHAIGRRLRISPQRVSQIHLGAIAKLRGIVPPP